MDVADDEHDDEFDLIEDVIVVDLLFTDEFIFVWLIFKFILFLFKSELDLEDDFFSCMDVLL